MAITSNGSTNGHLSGGEPAPGRARPKKNALILSDVAGQIDEEQTYQAKLRGAMFDAITEADVSDVVKGIVARAKEGDAKAIDDLFRYVLGGSKPVSLTQNNYYDRD